MKNIAFLFLFLGGSLFAQDRYADSLKQVLKKDLHDTVRIQIYIDLAEYFPEEQDWLPFNEKALDLAEEKLIEAKGNERRVYLKAKASSMANLAYYYDEHGQKEKSIAEYYSALKILDEIGDEEGKAVIYSNLAVILTNQKDYNEAIDYLKKALAIKKKYGKTDLAINYINLGVAYENEGDTTKGLHYYRQAMKAAEQVNDHVDLSTALNNIGSHYFQNGYYKKSIPYLSRAINECQEGGDEPGAAWIIANLGMAYLNYGMKDSASYYLFQAKEISDRYTYPYLAEAIAEKLYYYYKASGDWENAHAQYLIRQKLADSLQNVSAQKEALRQKMEYDHGLETAKIQLMREEEQKRSGQQKFYLIIVSVLILLIAIIMYSRFRITKKQKQIIEGQKAVVEEKNSEITSSINYAQYLQRAILPGVSDLFSEFSDGFLVYLPKDIVAGDFYWKHDTVNFTFLAVADCTGHGVPGAMVSVVCANALDKAVQEDPEIEPGKLLDRTRDLVVTQFSGEGREMKDGMDIALIRIEKNKKEVLFAGANNPCWLRRDDEWLVYSGDRQPIGQFDHAKPFGSIMVDHQKGDWLYLFSDGIVDQFGGDAQKKLRSAGLKQLLSELDTLSGSERCKKVESFFSEWKKGLEQIDDVCLIGIKL